MTAESPLSATPSADLARQVDDQPVAALSLLERVLESNVAERRDELLGRFLAEKEPAAALALWLGKLPKTDADRKRARLIISRDIARIDELISTQINRILHHPDFQRLECSWRGLWLMTGAVQEAKDVIDRDGERGEVKVRILNITKRELKKDFDRASEFDQSELFKKVYEQEFGMAGGEPFGMLVADYEFSHRPDDLDMLGRMSEVAAASFAPLITAPRPELLGVDEFSTLQQPLDYEAIFSHLSYVKWRSLRDRSDSQFLGLALPRTLMRAPYQDGQPPRTPFRFHEEVSQTDRSGYLWGSAAWAFAVVAIRAYASCGWFADIRGVAQDTLGGGVVTGLPTHEFSTDSRGVAVKSSVEVSLSENAEAELGRQGFVPLCHCHDTSLAAFFSNSSVHRPKVYDDPLATTNARISAMLQYIMCASRFAHYLKILGRQKIGSFQSAQELENYLNLWLSDYVTPDERAAPSVKARYPLREGRTEVREMTARPGCYQVLMYLQPHYQLDQLSAAIHLEAQLTPQSPAG